MTHPQYAEKILYAVAFSRKVRTPDGQWVWVPAPISYTKAHSQAEARAIIIRGEPTVIDIIACAPALGFWHGEKTDKILSAT